MESLRDAQRAAAAHDLGGAMTDVIAEIRAGVRTRGGVESTGGSPIAVAIVRMIIVAVETTETLIGVVAAMIAIEIGTIAAIEAIEAIEAIVAIVAIEETEIAIAEAETAGVE